MPTISRELAEGLVENEGKRKGDPRAYCVLKYQNRTFDKWDWAVCYNERQYQKYYRSDNVGGIDILWASDAFNEAREKEIEEEELAEAASFMPDLDFS